MEKLRVKNKAINIEVNDDGEYITLDFNDEGFVPRFYDMLAAFDSQYDDFYKRAVEVDEMSDEPDEYGVTPKMKAIATVNRDFHELFKDNFEVVFGKDACRKIFGNILPSIELYDDFFSQIKPIILKHGAAHVNKRKKYSSKREGNV